MWDMRIGYARVSTEDQTLDLQRDALKRAKCRQVYEEQATGKNIARPQLEAASRVCARETPSLCGGLIDWDGI
jgi:DNA invertase Pin-like site-specific DNA recombinase